jgi:hydroxymethylbilane synthase
VRRLVLGTRGSALALRQTELVLAALRNADPRVDIETLVVRTEGDRRHDVPLEAMGGQGVFVKEIEQRLADGEIDLAVHSLKDMPAETPEALVIGALLPRGDARDALIGRDGLGLAGLAPAALIGSDSRRRALQIAALRADVRFEGIRGNVDTRLRKVEAGEYDAIVLAAAGLERLDLLDRATEVFSTRAVLPAAGQGTMAVECRRDDAAVLELLGAVDDLPTRTASEAERGFMRALGAGCSLPVAAYATVAAGRISLEALIADEAGKLHRASAQGPVSTAESVGKGLAYRLRIEARA